MQFSTFSFAQQHNVRAFEQNGMAWFVAVDICNALEIKNVTQALEKLDEDERAEIEVKDNLGRTQTANIINESGLYILILRSRKAMEKGTVAWKFRKWVTAEVLPTIRKTGSYQNPQHGQDYLNEWEQEQIRQAVKVRSIRTGETTQAIYIKLHAYMGCDSYMNICQADFQTALNFLASIENAPSLFTEPSNALDDKTILSMAQTLLYAQDMRRFINRYYLAFADLGLERNGALHGFIHKTEPSFAAVRRYIEKEGMRLIQENTHKAQAAWLLQHIQQTAGIPYSL